MLTFYRDLFAPPRHLILLVMAAWIGLFLAEKRTERHSIAQSDLANLAFYTVIAFLLGGRISFALQNIPAFAKSPLDIVSVSPDLFDALGGLALGLIAGFVFGQRRGLALWPVLDALTPWFAILAAGLGLSHLAAGTAFGSPTELPWGIDLWNATRHPTQLYELFASILIFVWIWFQPQDPRPGLQFLLFGTLTAGAQLFIQAFRGDSTLFPYGLKQEQVVDWIALATFFILIEVRIRATKPPSRVRAAAPKKVSHAKS